MEVRYAIVMQKWNAAIVDGYAFRGNSIHPTIVAMNL